MKRIKSFFKRQLRTVIEWEDQSPDLLFYKYPAPTSEIKDASQLIVSPGQGCILVYNGKVQGVITTQGIYYLESQNHPFITTLLNVMQYGESEYKMHLYFFRLAETVNQGWGTPSPIKYMDPVYGFPVELGMYGSYSFKISDPELFFTEIVGSKDVYRVEDSNELLLSRLPEQLVTCLAGAGYSYAGIDAKLVELSTRLKESLAEELPAIGLELTDFRIQGTVFDEATLQRIGKIADMTAASKAAAEAGLSYVELQKLKALRDAARNEGGLAGAGLQLGAGMEVGKTFTDKTDEIIDNSKDPYEALRKLKKLFDEEIINEEEYEARRKTLLDAL